MVGKYLGAKVLVTGADGFIGSHLTEALVSAGAEVTALAQYNSFDNYGWLDDVPEHSREKSISSAATSAMRLSSIASCMATKSFFISQH